MGMRKRIPPKVDRTLGKLVRGQDAADIVISETKVANDIIVLRLWSSFKITPLCFKGRG